MTVVAEVRVVTVSPNSSDNSERNKTVFTNKNFYFDTKKWVKKIKKKFTNYFFYQKVFT